MRARVSVVTAILFNLLLLPSRVFEEGMHAVAALPFAEQVVVRLNPREDVAETLVEYRKETPNWAKQLAHIAPELTASVAAFTVIGFWFVNGATWWPASTLDWLLLWFLGAQFLGLVLPEEGGAPGGENGD